MTETCSCLMICPCWLGVKELMKMDQGWCATAFLFQFERGSSEGVDLAGRTVAVATDFPGPTLLDGHGTGRLYVEEDADPAQREELEAIFHGRRGGFWGAARGWFDQWLPTQPTRITVTENAGNLAAAVGPFGHVQAKVLRNAAGQVVRLQNADVDAASDLAPSASFWHDPEMPRKFKTDSGKMERFVWKA